MPETSEALNVIFFKSIGSESQTLFSIYMVVINGLFIPYSICRKFDTIY